MKREHGITKLELHIQIGLHPVAAQLAECNVLQLPSPKEDQ
jgi:hypothetical protein